MLLVLFEFFRPCGPLGGGVGVAGGVLARAPGRGTRAPGTKFWAKIEMFRNFQKVVFRSEMVSSEYYVMY